MPFLEAHPLGLQDDAACVALAGGNPSAGPQLDTANDGSGEPAHCVVCHLMRAMSGAVSSDVTTLAAPFVASSTRGPTDDPTFATALAASSSRGPPAIL